MNIGMNIVFLKAFQGSVGKMLVSVDVIDT